MNVDDSIGKECVATRGGGSGQTNTPFLVLAALPGPAVVGVASHIVPPVDLPAGGFRPRRPVRSLRPSGDSLRIGQVGYWPTVSRPVTPPKYSFIPSVNSETTLVATSWKPRSSCRLVAAASGATVPSGLPAFLAT